MESPFGRTAPVSGKRCKVFAGPAMYTADERLPLVYAAAHLNEYAGHVRRVDCNNCGILSLLDADHGRLHPQRKRLEIQTQLRLP